MGMTEHSARGNDARRLFCRSSRSRFTTEKHAAAADSSLFGWLLGGCAKPTTRLGTVYESSVIVIH